MKEKNMQDTNNLKSKVMSGLVWTFGERIIAQCVSFIVSIILARILLPEEYGVIAIVLVFINIANVFVSNGFGESLVRKTDSNEMDFSTVFYCSFVFSWVLYAVLFVSAPYIASFYKQEMRMIELLFQIMFSHPLGAGQQYITDSITVDNSHGAGLLRLIVAMGVIPSIPLFIWLLKPAFKKSRVFGLAIILLYLNMGLAQTYAIYTTLLIIPVCLKFHPENKKIRLEEK